MNGLVIKSTGSWYTVRTADGDDINCKVKGNFRLKGIRTTNPVAVGDDVISLSIPTELLISRPLLHGKITSYAVPAICRRSRIS